MCVCVCVWGGGGGGVGVCEMCSISVNVSVCTCTECMCTFWDKVTGSADNQNTKVDQHISIVAVVFRSMYNECVSSFLVVQFKFFGIWPHAHRQTDRQTYTLQCSPVGVGLAQARPTNTSCATINLPIH